MNATTMTPSTTQWRLHGVSVTGHRHRSDNMPCQDAFRHRSTGPDTFLLAVADGAGSRSRSREGAEMAVELADLLFLPASPLPQDPRDVEDFLRARFTVLRAEFIRRTQPHPEDFATTLTVVVHTGGWLGYLSVGDGFAVLRAGVRAGEPQFHLLPQPAPVSEYSNEAFFVTSDDAAQRLQTACVLDSEVTGILLCTDGLTQAAVEFPGNNRKRAKHNFVSRVLGAMERPDIGQEQEAAELARLLGSRRLAADNADDKTLLRAVRGL
ncbi:PP2C family serine/threonine-protein phosphatase [Streptomyces sp. GbtcB6]|uniref:PP2C family serine/threonine-protein phosphatase n=1 Tax=Streptomyces sp. GbtcB6 TaxID=2824751 RepID=UPI0020C6A6B3|nr:PP2C family serine/threonine-protein phosphatase [Streptomyces sp. GbtcB6]